MTDYRISEATGTAHWTLPASNPSDALDKLAQAHGYRNHAHACSEIGIAAQTLLVAEAEYHHRNRPFFGGIAQRKTH